jgi:hypothetical protein
MSVQAEIAEWVLPRIEGALATQPLEAQRLAISFELQLATASRQAAIAQGATHDADPRWAKPALMESWCTAALLRGDVYRHVHSALDE